MLVSPPSGSAGPAKVAPGPTTPTVVTAPALVIENAPRQLTPAEQAIASEATNPAVDSPARATRTSEQERTSLSQREINLKWESTQQWIALSVTWSALFIAGCLALWSKAGDTKAETAQLAACVFVYGVANLVIGFYFGRTNHQRTGGVGGENVGR